MDLQEMMCKDVDGIRVTQGQAAGCCEDGGEFLN